MTDTTSTETTTTTEKKGPSKLEVLHKEWLGAGGKLPSKTEGNKLVKELEAARNAVLAAEEALEKAKEKFGEVSLRAVRTFGAKTNLPLNGVPHAPMCRGDAIFYRTLAANNTWTG